MMFPDIWWWFGRSPAISGTAAATLARITASATGTVTVTGTGSATLARILASGAGTGTVTGTGSASLAGILASATGTVTVTGTGAATLGRITGSGTDVTILATEIIRGSWSSGAEIAGKWSDEMTIANQNLSSLYRGTDGSFIFTNDAAVSDASWTTLLLLKSSSSGPFTLSGTGPTAKKITFPYIRSGTLAIPADQYQFNVVRTDDGANDLLAKGYISVSSTIRDP